MDKSFLENNKTIFSNNNAFTLAEVLITLAVIGIVAAISVPSLMNNINEKQYKVAWQKGFATMSQAYANLKQKNGGSLDEYFGGDTDCSVPLIQEFIDEFLIIRKSTAARDTAELYYLIENYDIEYKDLAGNRLIYNNISRGNAILNDGTTIFFRAYDPNYALIWMDVNGYQKGPNVVGKDMFVATYTKNWIKPVGAPGTYPNANCENTPATYLASHYGFHSTTIAGTGCSAEYLYK